MRQDGYKLFEFDLTSESTKPISCPGLRGRVSDVSLSCTPEGCVPVALAGNRVVHCKSGPMTVQDSLAQFTVLGDGVTRPAFRKVFVSILLQITYSCCTGTSRSSNKTYGISWLSHSRYACLILFAFRLMLFQEAVVSVLGIETH